MKLIDLVGTKTLSGIDVGQYPDGECANFIRIILDGNAYELKEDPDDGYRSQCEDVAIFNGTMKNTFGPQPVVCSMSIDPHSDILEIKDALSEELILRLGTDCVDNYYPCCVLEYNPENMSVNQGR